MPDAHRPAAVVRPLIWGFLVTTIVPAPMKPRPDTTCAPIREMSVEMWALRYRYSPVMAAMDAPMQIRMWVRNPAGRFL